MYCDNQTGRAESALHAAGIDERSLYVGGFTVRRQSFHGDDIRVDRGGGHDEACAHRFTIHHDRARTTFSLFAGPLCSRQAQTFAQYVEQTFTNPCILNLMTHAVDRKGVELVALILR